MADEIINDGTNTQELPQDGGHNHSRIIQINIEEEMKSAYIDYSMSVIVGCPM